MESSLVCKNHGCKKQFASIREFLTHHHIHFADAQFRIRCPYRKCIYETKHIKSLHTHIRRLHASKSVIEDAHVQCSLRCPIEDCKKEILTISELLADLRRHLRQDSLSVKCPFAGCKMNYVNESSFKTHICSMHSI